MPAVGIVPISRSGYAGDSAVCPNHSSSCRGTATSGHGSSRISVRLCAPQLLDAFDAYVADSGRGVRVGATSSTRSARTISGRRGATSGPPATTTGRPSAGPRDRRHRRRGDLPRQPERRTDAVPGLDARRPRRARARGGRHPHLQPVARRGVRRRAATATSGSRTCRSGTSTPPWPSCAGRGDAGFKGVNFPRRGRGTAPTTTGPGSRCGPRPQNWAAALDPLRRGRSERAGRARNSSRSCRSRAADGSAGAPLTS